MDYQRRHIQGGYSAVSKTAQIGMEYAIAGAKPPDEDHINKLTKIISDQGINVSAGS